MTLFERIAAGEIPADIVYEDGDCIAFRDIDPQAPVHFLIVPRKPIPRIAEASSGEEHLIGHLLAVAAKLAAEMGVGESGFRIVVNNGPHGGETVPHLHVHLLGGRAMAWPPG